MTHERDRSGDLGVPDQDRERDLELRDLSDVSDLELSQAGSILGNEALEASWAADSSDRQTIGSYRVVRQLGRGGHGDAYLAHRDDDDSMVTVKLLRRELSDVDETHRVWRELAALERCRCDAVPELVDHGLVDGRLYMAYSYVDGAALDEHAHRHCRNERDRVDLVIRVCEAVQMLHERAVIHRDLKPSNLLVGESGQVFVVDMGTSIILEEASPDATRTLEGVVLGTPAFMAPEQARGDRSGISTRTDVFSVGAIACSLLTGETPFPTDGPYHEVIRRVATTEPRRPREIHPKLAKGLDQIVAKATAAKPADRYASVSEFAADLDRWKRGLPTEAAPTFGALVKQTAATVRRRPWISGLVAAMFLTIVGTGITAMWVADTAAEAQDDRDWNRDFAGSMATFLQAVGDRTETTMKYGDYYGVLHALYALVAHVRSGGELEAGLVTFDDQMVAMLEEEMRKVEDGVPTTGHLPDGGAAPPAEDQKESEEE